MQPGHKGVPANVSSTVPDDRMLIYDNECDNGDDCWMMMIVDGSTSQYGRG